MRIDCTKRMEKRFINFFPTSSSVTDRETTEWILWLVRLCLLLTVFGCKISCESVTYTWVFLFFSIFSHSSHVIADTGPAVAFYFCCNKLRWHLLLLVPINSRTHTHPAARTSSHNHHIIIGVIMQYDNLWQRKGCSKCAMYFFNKKKFAVVFFICSLRSYKNCFILRIY